MAHRKAGGTAKNLRDSNPKYLGIKLADGQKAQPGSIIVRQRGTPIIAGKYVSPPAKIIPFSLSKTGQSNLVLNAKLLSMVTS